MASFITLPSEIHFIIADFLCFPALSPSPPPLKTPPQKGQLSSGPKSTKATTGRTIRPIINLIQALQTRPPSSINTSPTNLVPRTDDPFSLHHLLQKVQHTYTTTLATVPITIIHQATSTKDESLPDLLFGDYATSYSPGIFGTLFTEYKLSSRTKHGGDGTTRAERLFWEVFLTRWEDYLKTVRPCNETVVRRREAAVVLENSECGEVVLRRMGKREAFELTTEGWIEVEILREAVRARRLVPTGLMLRRQVERDGGKSGGCISRDMLSREFERLVGDSKVANAVVGVALEVGTVHDNG